MNRAKKGFLLLLILIGILSCNDRDWEKVSVKKIRAILPELTMAKAYFSIYNTPDSIRKHSYEEIFEKYGITESDWDSTMYWYAKNDLLLYENFYSRLDDSIRQIQVKLQKKVDKLADERRQYDQWRTGQLDSVNLLSDSLYPYELSRKNYLYKSFSYKPVYGYKSNTKLEMIIDIKGLSSLSKDSLYMLFEVYNKGAVDTLKKLVITESGIHKLSLKPKEKADSISGSISGYLDYTLDNPQVRLDSISLVKATEITSNLSIVD